MPIMLPFNKCLLLALIRRTWIIDFLLVDSDGAESLGKQSMLRLQWVIMASIMASNVPDGLLKRSIKLEAI